MRLFNQPRGGELGAELEDNLASSEFDILYIMAAYARRSGVSRLKPYLERFSDGGGEIQIVVGIDQNNTSKQALEGLLPVCDELYTYHSESLTQTFHPKVYALENIGEQSIVYVGSNNLTAGGLFTNYELCARQEYQLSDEDDNEEFQDFISIFESYSDPESEMCRILDSEEIDNLMEGGYLKDEESSMSGLSDRASKVEERPSLFGSEHFEPPEVEVVSPEIEGVAKPQITAEGFWKKLSQNDVSTTSSPGQIIIPKKFLGYFPPLTDWEITSSGARQADAYFNVLFGVEDDDPIRINNVRVIHYVPAPDHPRPNDEVRFTFRDRDVLRRLDEDDLLVFRQTEDPQVWFSIEVLSPGSREYEEYGDGRYDSI